MHAEPSGDLRFEHPTVPGNGPGGWMQRMKDEGLDILKPIFSKPKSELPVIVNPIVEAKKEADPMINPEVTRLISLKELKEHNSEEEPWFVVNGQGLL